jgi:hypothetical protein
MNNTTGKWLVRAGSLILLLGFFLPSMAVSCSGVKESFTLYTLATSPSSSVPLVFLVLLGAITAMVFSVIPAQTRQQRSIFLIGQLVSVVAGALGLFISVLTLYSQFSNLGGASLGGVGLGLNYTLEFGFFILLLGYLSSGAGIILQYLEERKIPGSAQSFHPESRPEPPPDHFQEPANVNVASWDSAPRLEVAGGGVPHTVIPLVDNLQVGRGHDCQLQLPGSQVSRLHARFRSGNGSWFIQDQNSSTGTFVNGKRVQAIRLNPGDQIKIGDTTIVFRTQS